MILSWSTLSINLDSYIDRFGVRIRQEQDRKMNIAKTGSIETVNLHTAELVTINSYVNGWPLRQQLRAWWEWAKLGKSFSVAVTSSAMLSTVVTGTSAAAGTTNVSVGTTTTLSVGSTLLIRGDTGADLLTVSSFTTGASIGFTRALMHTYSSGALVRNLHYWSSAVLMDTRFSPEQLTSSGFLRFSFQFREVR